MVAIGDHYRPAGGNVPADDAVRPGVYRVVGTGDPVVLLRVATDGGGRVNSGEIHRIDAAALAESFEPAENPDAGIHPLRAIEDAASGFYWQFRRFF